MVELLPCATPCDLTSGLRESFGRKVHRDSVPTQPSVQLSNSPLKVPQLLSLLLAGASPNHRAPQKFSVDAVVAIAAIAVVVDFSAVDLVVFDVVVDHIVVVVVGLVFFVVDLVVVDRVVDCVVDLVVVVAVVVFVV